MANWEALLGLPLDIALEKVRALGIEPRVLVTCAPRRKGEEAAQPRSTGTLRVIRARDGELTVSAFQDGAPEKV